mmetsp:Transcript_17946/g.41868  ORF Transcript_17946/g.41868 Transcript_17946/m.41868 type:complete len:764 (-) Transcript_17946:182-2473(-)
MSGSRILCPFGTGKLCHERSSVAVGTVVCPGTGPCSSSTAIAEPPSSACWRQWFVDRCLLTAAGVAVVASCSKRVGRSRKELNCAAEGSGAAMLALHVDTVGPNEFSVSVSKLPHGLSSRSMARSGSPVKQSDAGASRQPSKPPWLPTFLSKAALDEVPPLLSMSRGSTASSTATGGPPAMLLHVNFLFASPLCHAGSSDRLPPLNVRTEFVAVQKALEHSCSSASICLDVSAATVDNFSRLATAPPPSNASSSIEWWHIAAHAGPSGGTIVLENEDGCAHVQDASFFASSLCRPPFGAVILSCASEGLGQALLEAGSAFVLITRGSLRDSAAKLFTEHFYRHLFAHWGSNDQQQEIPTVLPSPLALTSMPSTPGSPFGMDQWHLANIGSSATSSDSSTSSRSWDVLASTVRAAFDAGKEALLRASSPATRAEAAKIELLEGSGKRCISPVSAPRIPRGDSGVDGMPATLGLGNAGGSTCPWTEKSIGGVQSPDGEEPSFGPHVCEDFIGRAKELQQVINYITARRLVVLHGPPGAGKSSFCAEFCRFVAAPGRKLSAVRQSVGAVASSADGASSEEWKHRLGFVSLEEVSKGGQDTERVTSAVLTLASQLGGSSCLVVDDAEQKFGWHDSIAIQLLRQFASLGLLLVRRRPLYRLDGCDRWKPVNLELGPLSDQEASRVFLARVHRPLFERDFSRGGDGHANLRYEEVLPRLAAHPKLRACRGSPRHIVRLAATVTKELPSLLDVGGDDAFSTYSDLEAQMA